MSLTIKDLDPSVSFGHDKQMPSVSESCKMGEGGAVSRIIATIRQGWKLNSLLALSQIKSCAIARK